MTWDRGKAKHGNRQRAYSPRSSAAEPVALLLPARRQRPLELLQHERLILCPQGSPRRCPAPAAPAAGSGFCNRAAGVNPSPTPSRRGARALSVVDARPPHDVVRWSGRANLTCVVQLRGPATTGSTASPDPCVPATGPRCWVSVAHPCQVRRQPRVPLGCPSEIACHQATCGAAPRRACGRAPPWLSSCPGEWRRAWPRP